MNSNNVKCTAEQKVPVKFRYYSVILVRNSLTTLLELYGNSDIGNLLTHTLKLVAVTMLGDESLTSHEILPSTKGRSCLQRHSARVSVTLIAVSAMGNIQSPSHRLVDHTGPCYVRTHHE